MAQSCKETIEIIIRHFILEGTAGLSVGGSLSGVSFASLLDF